MYFAHYVYKVILVCKWNLGTRETTLLQKTFTVRSIQNSSTVTCVKRKLLATEEKIRNNFINCY
jgi:hypothetical protein